MNYDLNKLETRFFYGISNRLEDVEVGTVLAERVNKELDDKARESLNKLERYGLIQIAPDILLRNQINAHWLIILTVDGYNFAEMLKSHEDL